MADIAGLMAELDRIRDQRNRYRDALVKIICARSVAEARQIVARTFKEEPCQTSPQRTQPPAPTG